MSGKAWMGVAAAVAMLCLSVPAGAQTTWHDVQVADIETLRDKFIGLAEAFEEAQYDWQPMDGVRSVREVLGLTVAEANLFPTAWGSPPGPGADPDFEAELTRASALPKGRMVEELRGSFAYLIEVVSEMDETQRASQGSYFGRPMPVHASVATAMSDMHEHLGQLIAYARTNRVVPPWSR
jgi:hypothetical protein